MATTELGTLLRHIEQLTAGHGVRQWTDRQLLDDFTARRDDAAFAALLARHGPMVLRVCRRVLHHEQDAEDAFQATFLVLARNTGSIRKRDTLGSWLHGVAYRTAMNAKRSAARRRNHEARLRAVVPQTTTGPTWDETQAVLDEEIQRLPPCFRSAFVLCVLEGKSGAEAAGELGCKEGTVKSRVSRARRLLQQRLARRGIKLAVLLAALSVADKTARAALPAALVRATLHVGLLVAAGSPAAGLIPSHVAALAAGVTRAMFLTKMKIITVVFMAITCSLAGAGLLARRALAAKAVDPPAAKLPEQAPGKAITATPQSAAAPNAKDGIVFAGRVLDPEGKPVQGARLFLISPELKKLIIPIRTRSRADGTYRFTVSKAEFDRTHSPEPWKHTPAVALAEGYGLGLPLIPADKMAANQLPSIEAMTIQLAKDDVPIAGRILDLQGKPVAGARVRVRGIQWPIRGDLTAFIQTLKTRREGALPLNQLLIGLRDPNRGGWNLDSLYPPVVTDAQGRFRIQGVGRERVADLLIEKPTIETKYVYAMTRPGETITVPAYKGNPFNPLQPLYIYYGATFDHVAAPSKPVVGVVRDVDTGRPIAGAVVEKSNALPVREPRPIDDRVRFRAVTDNDGHYRITGLPRDKGNELRASPPAGQPYLMSAKAVPETPGLEPVTVDFPLKRGVWIDVKVTDKVTGKPVRCGVQYFLFDDNPHLKEAAGLVTNSHVKNRAEDGTFRLVGLPGRGVVAALADEDHYLHGIGAAKIKGLLPPRTPRTLPALCLPEQFHTLAEVNLDPGAEPVKCHLVLDPGRTLTVTVVGPDGQPLAGAYTNNFDSRGLWMPEPLKTATFTVSALEPGAPRRLLFLHREKHLAGTLLLRGDEQNPLTAKLEPWGVLTGRLVPPNGEPATDFQIVAIGRFIITPGTFSTPPSIGPTLPYSITPDKDGNFRVEGLVPGLKYGLNIVKGGKYLNRFASPRLDQLSAQSGEVRNLGDIQEKPTDK